MDRPPRSLHVFGVAWDEDCRADHLYIMFYQDCELLMCIFVEEATLHLHPRTRNELTSWQRPDEDEGVMGGTLTVVFT